MSIARRAALLPLAVVVAGIAAAPAHAATATWRTPTDNATYTSTSSGIEFLVSLSRSLTDRSEVHLGIAVPGPQAGPFRVASTTGNELRFTFNPGCPNHAGACTTGVPAYNGRYTASLSGGASGTRTVVLAAPPAAPTGVSATATGQRRVKVSWNANREPDLTGYDVYTEDGSIVAEHLPVDTLSYEFDLPDTGYGGQHEYVLRAHRLACSNCSGSTDQLTSGWSSPGSVTLTEPTPEPQPTGGGYDGGGSTGGGTGGGSTGGGNNGNGGGGYNGGGGTGGGTGTGSGSTGGGTGGSTGGGTGEPAYNDGSGTGGLQSGPKPTTGPNSLANQRTAFGVSFKNFAPKLGAPKLPPQPKFTEAPLPEGTYDPMLDYGPQEAEGPNSLVAEGGGITTTLVNTFSEVFQGRKLFRSIAIALLLLLAAGHLRLWLRHEPTR